MRWTQPVVLVLLGSIGGIAARPSAQQTIRDLGTLPGGDYSEAYNINDKGQIVGASETTGPGCDPAPFNVCTHAFLWEEGTMTPLRSLGGPFSYAYGINNRGQVAGLSTTASGEYHAVTWTPEGQITDLGILPGDNFGQANAINDRGQIVGWSSGGTTRAFVWEKGVLSELGTLNGSFSAAVDINKHGPQHSSSIDKLEPVIWVDGRVVEPPSLSAPPDLSNWTAAHDVNNRGQIVPACRDLVPECDA